MTIYPAIDIYGGKAVRLKRGDFAQMTVYGDNPINIAHDFKRAGAMALHVVDLEGAQIGKPVNNELIAKIAVETGLFVQVGGGIRTLTDIEAYINAGVKRVILGTAAVEQAGFLSEAVSLFGKAIAVSADVHGDYIAIKGWAETTDQNVFSFCKRLIDIGVETLICTDISKDGMQSGSNIELYRALRKELPINLIASGGVSSLEEIRTLAGLGMNGVILGKALYEGTVDLRDVCL